MSLHRHILRRAGAALLATALVLAAAPSGAQSEDPYSGPFRLRLLFVTPLVIYYDRGQNVDVNLDATFYGAKGQPTLQAVVKRPDNTTARVDLALYELSSKDGIWKGRGRGTFSVPPNLTDTHQTYTVTFEGRDADGRESPAAGNVRELFVQPKPPDSPPSERFGYRISGGPVELQGSVYTYVYVHAFPKSRAPFEPPDQPDTSVTLKVSLAFGQQLSNQSFTLSGTRPNLLWLFLNPSVPENYFASLTFEDRGFTHGFNVPTSLPATPGVPSPTLAATGDGGLRAQWAPPAGAKEYVIQLVEVVSQTDSKLVATDMTGGMTEWAYPAALLQTGKPYAALVFALNRTGEEMAVSYGTTFTSSGSFVGRAAWSPIVTAPAPPRARGDLNASGSVDVADAVLGLRVIVQLETAPADLLSFGDMDRNGAFNVSDVTRILQIVVGAGG